MGALAVTVISERICDNICNNSDNITSVFLLIFISNTIWVIYLRYITKLYSTIVFTQYNTINIHHNYCNSGCSQKCYKNRCCNGY